MDNQLAEEETIRCMQMPIEGMQLLLPNAVVAEIIGYDHSSLSDADNDILRGEIAWRGAQVPVVSIESMCQQSRVEPGSRSRIAVVYHPDGDPEIPYLGIILKDIPRAYLADSLRLEGKGGSVDCEFLAFRIEEMIDDYYVPDLDAIFRAVRPVV